MVGGSRTALIASALALLLAPAQATALGVEDFQPLVDAIDDGFVAPFEGALDGLDGLGGFGGQVIPAGFGAGWYAGGGSMSVTRGGAHNACGGGPQMFLEFSDKPFGFEPTLTFSYGGGGADDPRVFPACFAGRFDEADKGTITGPLSGAFSVTKRHIDQTWTLDVGAPDAQGRRAVGFRLMSDDGQTADTFDGVLTPL